MPRPIYRNSTGVSCTIVNDLLPPGIEWNDPELIVQWRSSTSTQWNNITLQEGTEGSWVSGGWVELEDGEYLLGLPNLAIVPGDRVTIKVTYEGESAYDAIDAVLSSPVYPANFENMIINSAGAVLMQPSPINFNIFVPGSPSLANTSTPIYVKEKGRVLEFTADQDIESHDLVLILEEPNREDILIIDDTELTKTGNKVSITLPDELTQEEATIVWGIRHATTLDVYGFGSFSISYAPHEDDEDDEE